MATTNIAIASGKGGTGKTLVATNLAAAMEDCLLVDLDVEEPNCYVFQKNARESATDVHRLVPRVDASRCTSCGKCAEICEYGAIAVLPTKQVLVFEQICHSCGACPMLCPYRAMDEKDHLVGEMIKSESPAQDLLYGRLKVGEASAVPLIKAVKREASLDKRAKILDCPPGTACTAVESIEGADLCVLVTEPTPFGLHDLSLAHKVTEALGVPSVVFINKEGLEGADIEAFCSENDIPIIGKLRFERGIAKSYSNGQLLPEEYASTFEDVASEVKRMVNG